MSELAYAKLDPFEESQLTLGRVPSLPYADVEHLKGWADGLRAFGEADELANSASWVIFRPTREAANALMRMSVRYPHLIKQVSEAKDYCEALFSRLGKDAGVAEDLTHGMESLQTRVDEALNTAEKSERDARFRSRLAVPLLEAIYGLTVDGRWGIDIPTKRVTFRNAPGFLIVAELVGRGTIEEVRDSLAELASKWIIEQKILKSSMYEMGFLTGDRRAVTVSRFCCRFGKGLRWRVEGHNHWYHFLGQRNQIRRPTPSVELFESAYRLTALGFEVINPAGLRQVVTAANAAAYAKVGKRTFDRALADGRLPRPDFPGRKGQAHKWIWAHLRPQLQDLANRILEEQFPGTNFI